MKPSVIGCIPAGRQRYLELLVPHLLAARHIYSEIQLWVNTRVPSDVAYLQSLNQRNPGYFRLIPPDPGTDAATVRSICPFWRHVAEPGTVYIRTDDDILWLAPDAVERLVDYRRKNPAPFLVFANIINNPTCSYLHQRFGCIPFRAGVATNDSLCPIGWKSGPFAEAAHRSFLKHLAEGRTDAYRFGRWSLPEYPRFGINVCAWFGQDIRPQQDPAEMSGEEEFWVTCIRPRQLGRPNEICGQALFAHHAYYPQRHHLENTDILEQYRKYLPQPSTA